MFGRILDGVLEMKGYMICLAVSAVVMGLVYLLTLRRFRWNGFLIRIHGLFINLTMADLVRIALLFERLVFVVWSMVSMNGVGAADLILLALTGLILGILSGRPLKLLTEALNTCLLIAGFYSGTLLLVYMWEVQFDWSILAVYVLLGTFITAYCLYFFMRDIKELSKERI